MKTAKEFYKDEKGYCDEAMEGVPSAFFTIMERYAIEYHNSEVKKLNVLAVSKSEGIEREAQLNCDHEWEYDTFDHFGYPKEKYCIKCGETQAT